jgi:hypothetical protein
MRTIAIYLAGSAQQKGHENNGSFLTLSDLKMIEQMLQGYNVKFLNPSLYSEYLLDQQAVFGRDMLQVYCSDVVFVDARTQCSLSIGAEMMWAKMNQIPVLTLTAKEAGLGTKLGNRMHPFVESLSDKVVESLEEGASWIKDQLAFPTAYAKDVDTIIEAMQHYQACQFDGDTLMQKIINNNESLKERFNEILESTV